MEISVRKKKEYILESDYKYQDLSERIIAAAFKVHGELGQDFLEKVYKNSLAIELGENGIKYELEKPLVVKYHNKVAGEYFADMIVENNIIVEIKAVSTLSDTPEVQLVNYLKATGINVGLLLNFGKSVEIRRKVFG